MPKALNTPEEFKEQVPINIRWALEKRHVLNILTTDISGRGVLLKMEPYYINIDWDNRAYVIGRWLSGWRPPSIKNGWIMIFMDNIMKCNIMENRFKPRSKEFLIFKKMKEDTFIRPSNYEIMVK